MLEIAQRIVATDGVVARAIVSKPLPMDDPWHRKPDISRAVDMLNWRPVTSLDEGLTRTAQYFRQVVQQRDSLVAGMRTRPIAALILARNRPTILCIGAKKTLLRCPFWTPENVEASHRCETAVTRQFAPAQQPLRATVKACRTSGQRTAGNAKSSEDAERPGAAEIRTNDMYWNDVCCRTFVRLVSLWLFATQGHRSASVRGTTLCSGDSVIAKSPSCDSRASRWRRHRNVVAILTWSLHADWRQRRRGVPKRAAPRPVSRRNESSVCGI